MSSRVLEVLIDAVIVISSLLLLTFLLLYFFAPQDLYIQHQAVYGANYVPYSAINLNNFAFVPLATLVASLLLARKIKRPGKLTGVIRNLGLDYFQKWTKSESKKSLILNFVIVFFSLINIILGFSIIFQYFIPGTYVCDGQTTNNIPSGPAAALFEAQACVLAIALVVGLFKHKRTRYKVICLIILLALVAPQFSILLINILRNSCLNFF